MNAYNMCIRNIVVRRPINNPVNKEQRDEIMFNHFFLHNIFVSGGTKSIVQMLRE